MHDEQQYLNHLEAFDEETIGNWEDFFEAFSKTMYPIAAKYDITFGEALLAFKLNQVYNTLINDNEDSEDSYK